LIGNDGASIVASGGGNIVATGGGNIVATGGGNLIGNDGASIVATGGGNLIGNDGASLIGNDGASIVSNSHGDAAATAAFGEGAALGLSSANLSQGSRGWFVATSSGGQKPKVTVTTNPDGSMTGTLTMVFDSTSNPRIQDLQGLAFTVALDPATVGFASNNVTVNEGDGRATVTLVRTGDLTGSVTVGYATSNGTATDRSDYAPVFGTVTFGPNETQKTVTVPLIDNGYGTADAGSQRSFNLTIGNAVGGAIKMPNVATVTISNNEAATAAANPADDSRFYVRQHYLDFLGREPDQPGWDFWTQGIESCGAVAGCREAKRVDASAAFFLSIEFQETGFLVYRLYNAALERPQGMPRYTEFLRDTQRVGSGVVVNQGNWQAQLESNKQAFLSEFVNRREFQDAYPVGLLPAQYVDALYAHAKLTPTVAERQAAIDEFNTPVGARERVLRRVAENEALKSREFNRAFVLMQYFGYLRRGPDEAPDTNFSGWQFWLDKLNSFGGDYRRAEMVRAFISSVEYRQRFGR
jgi:hypothetical protein